VSTSPSPVVTSRVRLSTYLVMSLDPHLVESSTAVVDCLAEFSESDPLVGLSRYPSLEAQEWFVRVCLTGPVAGWRCNQREGSHEGL